MTVKEYKEWLAGRSKAFFKLGRLYDKDYLFDMGKATAFEECFNKCPDFFEADVKSQEDSDSIAAETAYTMEKIKELREDMASKIQSNTDKMENLKKQLKESKERADNGWERVHYLERKLRNTEALNDQLLLELARRQNADESGKVKYITVGKPELYIGGEKSGNCTVTLLDLKQTIPLMQSEDYKERFIAEWAQTRIRIAKLDRMLQRHYSGTLDFEPTCPIILLEKQLLAMKQYADMLEVRAAIENVELPTEKLMEGET